MKITEAITTYTDSAIQKTKEGTSSSVISKQISSECSRTFKDRDERRAVLYGVRETLYHEHGLDLRI